jgi:Leucine-rich repeat (LRR) protein
MECLKNIEFQDTGIEELPSSTEYLVRVKDLDLSGCTNLMDLPYNIFQLQHLEQLSFNGCTGIKEMPSSIGCLGKIERLDLGGCTNLMNFLGNNVLTESDFLIQRDCPLGLIIAVI